MVTLRQFDVFPNPSARTRDKHPYFIILQSDRLEAIATRVVAPIGIAPKIKLLERLLPDIVVEGQSYVVLMPDIGAIPVSMLRPAITNLESERYRIIAAIDLVFTGI